MNISNFLSVPFDPHPKLQSWLEIAASTTESLNNLTGEAKLRVINQSFKPTSWWETHVLDLNEIVFCREIIMSSHYNDCWYARTIVPKSVYDENKDFFKRLENNYLGQIVFKTDLVKRIQLFSYFIDKRNIEYNWVKKLKPELNEILGVRFSVFQFPQNQQTFYLVEIILPDLMAILSELGS